MHEWKIKRMSVKTLERWLDSVDKLLLHYLGAEGIEISTCPLCWADCDGCLWIIIEQKHCGEFARKLYPKRKDLGPSLLRRYLQFTKWKKARVIQLERWRCVIAGELAARYVIK